MELARWANHVAAARGRASRLRRVQRGWNQGAHPDGMPEGALGEACLWSYPNAAPNARDAWRSGSLFSHEGAVTRARFSPDGRWVATASRDSTVRLWHVGTQREVLNLKHDGDVNDVAFSPDGRHLVSGNRDRLARLWEVATGQLVGSPFWQSETVADAAFSPDGRTILTGSKHLARIWNFGPEGPKVSQLKVGGSVALSAVSADGSRLIAVSDKDDRDRRSVNLWQTASGRCLAALLLENAGRVSQSMQTGARWPLPATAPAAER